MIGIRAGDGEQTGDLDRISEDRIALFPLLERRSESDRLDRSLEESINLVLPYTARTTFSFSSHSLYTPTSFGRSLTSRESEAAYLEKLNEGIAKGTSWERVTEMIQLENSRKSNGGRQPTSFTPLSPSLHSSPHSTPLRTQHLSRSRSSDKISLLASARFARSMLTARIQNHQTIRPWWIRPSKDEGDPTSIKEGR